jgi:hypothetical protein
MVVGAICAAVGVSAGALYFCACFRNIRHRRYRPGSPDDPNYGYDKDHAYSKKRWTFADSVQRRDDSANESEVTAV